MAEPKHKQRLDEILITSGLLTEDQIKITLREQKTTGLKFGSQLLFQGFIDETELVSALVSQFDCEGVVLTGVDIPAILAKAIPKKIAIARKVMPFGYDTEANLLKIACEDPTDQNLIDEIRFVARGKETKLYIAAELALNSVIATHYLHLEIPPGENYLLEIPHYGQDDRSDTTKIAVQGETQPGDDRAATGPAILIVSDETSTLPLMRSLFEGDNYRVVITNSADDAIDMLGDQKFHTIFIKDTVTGDYLDLIDRVRKISPRTAVRYYESAAALLLGNDTQAAADKLLLDNLDLFTSLLSSSLKLPTNHSGQVGKYVEKLCRKLGLPDKDRTLISNAAYVHDIARYYYSGGKAGDSVEIIQLTGKLLESLSYSPVVIQMLRSMYVNLRGRFTRRLPIEALGGNILTIVDLFCDSIPQNERVSLNKFEGIQRKLRELVGKLFMTEVVEAFIEMIQSEILEGHQALDAGQVAIFATQLPLPQPLEQRLKNEGFRTVSHSSPNQFVDLYKRSKPDLAILVLPGEPKQIKQQIRELSENGINFGDVPTFLLTDMHSISGLTELLRSGIEDLIAIEDNLDILVTKLHKLRTRIVDAKRTEETDASGTRGSLADMNLIDLLQVMGPARKSALITVRQEDTTTGPFTMYLQQGQIVFAKLGNLLGAEAVYECLSWTDGNWTMDPVTADQIPEPNNSLANESILMEGCRLLDETQRIPQTA